MNLRDVEQPIRELQQQQAPLPLRVGPVGWRRQDHQGRWHLVDTNGLADWEMRRFGCEPVFAERKPMADAVAIKLSKQAKGVSLVRAVEAWHSIN